MPPPRCPALFPYTTLFRSRRRARHHAGRPEERMLENLEKELRKWRQSRASKPQREAPTDRSTVKVNGQEVLVVRKRSEEHTSELQSLRHLVCRLLLEKKKT